MKIGLEIELLAYDGLKKSGELGSGFNKFRRSFGKTLDFKYFNGYPRHNVIQNYSFLSSEGIRYYLESPRAVEVVTPPIELDGSGNGSSKVVNMLKQGVNNVLTHYDNLDFVPYSIHVNVSSLNSMLENRVFWNEVNPMTLFLGTNQLSKGVGARFYSPNNNNYEDYDKLNQRMEFLIDGETIMFENQLELLCKYYESILFGESQIEPQFIINGVSELEKTDSTLQNSMINFDKLISNLSFCTRVLSNDLKKSEDLKVLKTPDFLLINRLKDKLGGINELYGSLGGISYYDMISNITEKLGEQSNLFSDDDISFLFDKSDFENGNFNFYKYFTGDCLNYDSSLNPNYDNISQGESLEKFFEREKYFDRMRKTNSNVNGKFLPNKFNSINYSIVLNSRNLFDSEHRVNDEFGSLTDFESDIDFIDWKSVTFKGKKSKEKIIDKIGEF